MRIILRTKVSLELIDLINERLLIQGECVGQGVDGVFSFRNKFVGLCIK